MLNNFFRKTREPQKQYSSTKNKGVEVIRMPRISDTMKYGKIIKWYFQVGDYVKAGDVFAEVEVENTTIELELFVHGMVLHLSVGDGENVATDGIMAIIGNEGQDVGRFWPMK